MHDIWRVHHAVRLTSHIVLGAYLLSRPTHTTVVYVNSAPYYYTDGTYYVKKSNSVYVTVPPPSGAEIKTLPDGTVTAQFEGQDYSYYLGTFYLESGDQYQVVTAPVGATVTYAPKGAKKKTINGTTYFVYGGVYYKPKFVDGLTLYAVAANPTQKSTQPQILDEPPAGNITVKHDGTDYYYVDGKWYEEVEEGYEQGPAPTGASVPYLPDSATESGGSYVVGSTTYQPYQKDGVTLYKVVG